MEPARLTPAPQAAVGPSPSARALDSRKTSGHSETRDNRAREAFRWVALAAVIATYVLIVLGGVVRATGSGLGCPDWPLCQGQALPPPERTALIEFSHRAWGGVTSLLIFGAAALWIRVTRARPLALVGACAMGLLLVAQILLGALTVALELSPPVVTVHLGMALLVFGGLVWLAIEAYAGDGGHGTGDRNGLLGLAVAVIAVYVLMLIGALVRASGASWACVGFPACNGQALPFGANPLTDLHLLHRLGAYAVAAYLAITVVSVWRRQLSPSGPRLAAAAVGACVVTQIAIGAGMVSTGVPAVAQALHVAGAAALWGSVVALLAVTSHARSEADASAIEGPGRER